MWFFMCLVYLFLAIGLLYTAHRRALAMRRIPRKPVMFSIYKRD